MQIVNELKSKLQSHIDSVTALAKQAVESTEYNVNVAEIGSTEKQHAELNAYLNSLQDKQGLDDIVQDIMQEYEIDDGHALYETLNDLCHKYQSILEENIEVYLVAKSEIERIGTAMFGKSWMAQIAANLKNAKGEPLTRQTVQNWHRRGNLPDWAREQLETLVKKRENEIKAIAPIFS